MGFSQENNLELLKQKHTAFHQGMRDLWNKKKELFKVFRKRLEEEKIKELRNSLMK